MVKNASLAFLFLFSFSLSVSGAIRLGGSDLMTSVVSSIEGDLSGIDLSLEGSIRAWSDLQEGTVDAAIIAFPDDQPPSGDWISLPVAFQVVSIAVHESNPLEEISYANLVELFREGGSIEEWGGLIDNPMWSSRKVSTGLIRDRNGLALEIFSSKVMQSAQIRSTLLYADEAGALVDAIIEDSNFMAVVPDVIDAPLIKTVAVNQGSGDQSYTPSPDNVMFGDYPLRLAFYLVMPRSIDSEMDVALRELVYSDGFARALEASDYMPLPENERANYMNR